MRLKNDEWAKFQDDKESTQHEEQDKPDKEKIECHLKAQTPVLFLWMENDIDLPARLVRGFIVD
jgi:hypothetical protein